MILVDSDILIDFSRGDEVAAGTLTTLEQTDLVAISSITAMELVVGAFNKRDQRNIENFLLRFKI